jgi:hypothetical protein
MTGTLRGMNRLIVNCPDAGADRIWIGHAKRTDPGTPDVTDKRDFPRALGQDESVENSGDGAQCRLPEEGKPAFVIQFWPPDPNGSMTDPCRRRFCVISHECPSWQWVCPPGTDSRLRSATAVLERIWARAEPVLREMAGSCPTG